MTCIIAVSDHDKLYMGCDSAATDAYGATTIIQHPKVFQAGKNMLIGVTNRSRLQQILQCGDEAPDFPETIQPYKIVDDPVMKFLAGEFTNWIRYRLRESDYHPDEDWGPLGGELLIGLKFKLVDATIHRILRMGSTYDLLERRHWRFDAIGHAQPALGYLLACRDGVRELNGKSLIEEAMKAVETLSSQVQPPHTVLAI